MSDPAENAASSDAVMQTIAWARKQGFRVVPLRKQSKAAISQNYVDLNYDPPSDTLWRGRDLGVGIVTGPQHSGPVDVDLDCPEAVFFAERFLPSTAAIFGRATKQRSHYLYRTDADLLAKRAFNDPLIRGAGTTICEIRGDGGHQTVFPGSLHEATGEVIEWSNTPFPDVPRVDIGSLDFAVKKVAIATLIVRHLWLDGQRNEIIKHLAGMFYYLEWPIDEVKGLIQGVMDYTGDDDKTRVRTVTATYKKGEEGGKITGSNSLREFLGEPKLVDRILEWAGNEAAAMLQEYNERFAVVSIEGKFRIAETTPVNPSDPPTFYSKEDFLNFMATDTIPTDKKPVPKAQVWLASPRRRSYRTVDFVPGIEDAPGILNLWTGWAVKPNTKASCAGWLDLLYYTICGGDDTTYHWLLNWFANIVREPLNRVLTAPVISGKQGAGKSLLFGYFGRILGSGYLPVSNPEHIHGKFNRHLASTLLLHSEEALFAGDKRHSDIIKDLITGNTRIFEQKGIDAKNVRNHLRLAFTSNEVWAARAEDGDRRYTVIDMEDRKVDPSALARVLNELENEGPAALLHYLTVTHEYNRDLVRINIKNEALLQLKQVNFDPIASWWFECLKMGQVLPDYLWWACKPERAEWPTVVSSQALYLSMTSKMKDLGQRYIPENAMFAMRINKMLGRKLKRSQRYFNNPGGDLMPPEVRRLPNKQYAIDDLPPLAECRVAFEDFVGQRMEWPEPVKEEDKPLHDRY